MSNRSRAEQVAAANGTRALTDFRDVIGQVDAVTIAVPTEQHGDIALPFLSSGVSVLVEKPMARSLDEADAMIAAARQAGVVFARRAHRAVQPGRRDGAGVCSPIRASSKCTAWARFPSAASTSTSCST